MDKVFIVEVMRDGVVSREGVYASVEKANAVQKRLEECRDASGEPFYDFVFNQEAIVN